MHGDDNGMGGWATQAPVERGPAGGGGPGFTGQMYQGPAYRSGGSAGPSAGGPPWAAGSRWGADAPGVRIGDQERGAAMEALGDHLRAGRLDPHEYDERMEAVAAAKTMADLRPVFADLPAPSPFLAHRPVAAGTGPVPTGGRLGRTLVAVSPFLALMLFLATGWWFMFLLIPLSGAVIYGPDRHPRGPWGGCGSGGYRRRC